MLLSGYDKHTFDRGASRAKEALWVLLGVPLLGSWIPGSAWRVLLLWLFGACIGSRAVIKPGVRITFPWRLHLGDDVWIGERVWIDNLDVVRIRSNSCVSQGAYLCTGNHDWSADSFDLRTAPIKIEQGVWVCAFARIAPGTRIGERAIVGFGAVASGVLEPNTIYSGNPAKAIGPRDKRSWASEEARQKAC